MGRGGETGRRAPRARLRELHLQPAHRLPGLLALPLLHALAPTPLVVFLLQNAGVLPHPSQHVDCRLVLHDVAADVVDRSSEMPRFVVCSCKTNRVSYLLFDAMYTVQLANLLYCVLLECKAVTRRDLLVSCSTRPCAFCSNPKHSQKHRSHMICCVPVFFLHQNRNTTRSG